MLDPEQPFLDAIEDAEHDLAAWKRYKRWIVLSGLVGGSVATSGITLGFFSAAMQVDLGGTSALIICGGLILLLVATFGSFTVHENWHHRNPARDLRNAQRKYRDFLMRDPEPEKPSLRFGSYRI